MTDIISKKVKIYNLLKVLCVTKLKNLYKTWHVLRLKTKGNHSIALLLKTSGGTDAKLMVTKWALEMKTSVRDSCVIMRIRNWFYVSTFQKREQISDLCNPADTQEVRGVNLKVTEGMYMVPRMFPV